MRILAIETSCDETAVAIADFTGKKKTPDVRALSHIVSSQIALHKEYGGVVPNLARRAHERNLPLILLEALKEAGDELRSANDEARKEKKKSGISDRNSKLALLDSILEREQELLKEFKKSVFPLPVPDIDAIAVTYGPGLAPALWVGVNFARALSFLWNKPLIPANHMAGHLFSALLKRGEMADDQSQTADKSQIQNYKIRNIRFPALALLVSGNHTEIIVVEKPWKFQLIGQTLDDAAGEAFDKVARIIGFPYPGGPAISRLAEKGDPKKYDFPRPMLHSGDYGFSFSGLKTAVLYRIRDITGSISWKKEADLTEQQKADLAASFESAAIEVLVKKTLRAADEYGAKTALLGGGVSANKKLRRELGKALEEKMPGTVFLIPDLPLTGDNALMIAVAAFFCGKKIAWTEVQADANLILKS